MRMSPISAIWRSSEAALRAVNQTVTAAQAKKNSPRPAIRRTRFWLWRTLGATGLNVSRPSAAPMSRSVGGSMRCVAGTSV